VALIIWAHIPAVIYGALVEFAGFICPLTLLESDLRQRVGEAGYRGGFTAHYLVKLIYPPGLTHGMQVELGVLLLLVAIIGYWGFLRRRGRGGVRALADGLAAGTWGRVALRVLERRGYRTETDWRLVRAELIAEGRGWVEIDGRGSGFMVSYVMVVTVSG
jgi:Protein of Unknown function (DUF2784)